MDTARYKDLESLLFIGFIPYKISLGGVDFVFKSLNEIEYSQVQLMSGIKESPRYLSNFYLNYLFFSIYMINGVNILNKRIDNYADLINILKKYPTTLVSSFFTIFDKIAKKLEACLTLVEPYSYEDISRYSWAYKNRNPLNSPCYTGIAGSEELGINQFQKYWIVLNLREDKKESFEEKYSLFKFLASFTDSKAVKKIESQDKLRKEEDIKRKERIMTIGTEEELKYISGPTDTRDGIVRELEKQMKGEKDEHDLIVEEYEKSLRKNMLNQMNEFRQVQEERKQKSSLVLEEARPIGAQEMAERIKRRQSSPSIYFNNPDADLKSKYLKMSNVTDEDVLKESRTITREEYEKLINNPMFKTVHNPNAAEEEYKKQQKTLAAQIGLEDDQVLDFPNLRNN